MAAASWFGNIEPFRKGGNWSAFVQQLEAFSMLNNIAADKKAALLLTQVSQAVFAEIPAICETETPLSLTQLKDQLITGVYNQRVRYELLKASADESLENLLRLAKTVELADAKAARLGTPNVVNTGSTPEYNGGTRPSVETKATFPKCADAPDEVAKLGNQNYVGDGETAETQEHLREKFSEDEERYASDFWPVRESGNVECKLKKKVNPQFVTIKVNNIPLKMEIDSGAGVSAISKNCYEKWFAEIPLITSKISLRTYDKQKLPTLGYIQVEAEKNYVKSKELLYVVSEGDDDVTKRKQITCQLQKEFPGVFAAGIGTFTKGELKLTLIEGATPKFLQPRKMPWALRDKVENELARLQQLAIISPVEYSDWGTPIVPVLKSNGTLRLCGVYKVTLNKYLEVDRCRLPRVEEVLETLRGGKIFTKLDPSEAYQQLPLTQESQKLVVISTHIGLFKYHRLPYRVATGPGSFQRVMTSLLLGIPGTIVSIDDILITAATLEIHTDRVREVLKRLNEGEAKIKSVKDAPKPKDVSELRSFLGSINYYGSFIENMAQKLRALYECLEKDKFEWTEVCDKTFEKIKRELVSDKILVHFDPQKQTVLTCDASPYGISAVLAHRDEEDSAASARIFDPSKAIPEIAAARLQRWALFFAPFEYTIKHIQGKKNYADWLSRLPLPKTKDDAKELPISQNTMYTHVNCVKDYDFATLDWKAKRKCTREDETLSKVIRYCMDGWEEKSPIDESLKTFWSERESLTIDQGCVLWGHRVVIPNKLREIVLKELHYSHFGVTRMKALARSFVWWPEINKQIELITQACRACLETRKSPPKIALTPWAWPTTPWHRIHADFLRPFNGKTVLVIVDSHSKWPEAIIMQSMSESHTIKAFEEVFARHGYPAHLITDNYSTFVGKAFQSLLKVGGVRHSTTPPYCSATNGAAENFVGTFKRKVACIMADGFNLQEVITKFLFDYRSTPHATTQRTPASLALGRELKTRFSRLRPTPVNDCIVTHQSRQIQNYAGKRESTLKVGDSVMAREYKQGGKAAWKPGTVEIELIAGVTYLIRIDEKTVWKRHANQLIKCDGSIVAEQNEAEKKHQTLLQPRPMVRRSERLQNKKGEM
ncbi:uncharacterized protein K02A2.6-like [Neodiprion virginianus]|uniref:uncharacterized protein K02A2.6-like n=1 Tax=Neodiprion virginianus TaxID=2961670 RepID=UPI001EE766FC|nr:uncharacterized protein K02A2.6-like [Neodiprion virginianus]